MILDPRRVGGHTLPPVVLLGGDANALSLVRSLTRRGVEVRVAAHYRSAALHSRYGVESFPIESEQPREAWHQLLLEEKTDEWAGSVLFALEDHAVEYVSQHYQELATHFILDEHDPALRLGMLDKRRTLELAQAAGCPVPHFSEIETDEDITRVADTCPFPLLVKPIHSHEFKKVFPSKLFVANNEAELRERATLALGHGLRMMAVEAIPGPDSALNSYYTHISREGEHLFHFTKRIIRRSPPSFGVGSYHATEWLPETAEMGKRFFRGINFTGFGNIEFKRDPRDGQLKVIECNPRFTEAQELLTRSGLDAAWLVYSRLAGIPSEAPTDYRDHVHLWFPEQDFDSFRELRRRRQLTLGGWLRSVARRQYFPYFSLRDPAPGAVRLWDNARSRLRRRAVQLLGSTPLA